MARRWKSSDLVVGPNGLRRVNISVPERMVCLKKIFTGVVIGVDPSLRGTGVAVVRCENKKNTLLYSLTIKTKGSPTEALAQIARAINQICRDYHPAAAAVEEAIFAQNHRTAITLGSARGAALASLAMSGVLCHGYAPARIKQAVVGYGRATKEQMAAMTRQLLALPTTLPFDEADAAAAALCFIYSTPIEPKK